MTVHATRGASSHGNLLTQTQVVRSKGRQISQKVPPEGIPVSHLYLIAPARQMRDRAANFGRLSQPSLCPETQELIVDELLGGMDMTDLSLRLGVSFGVVQKIAKAAGIQMLGCRQVYAGTPFDQTVFDTWTPRSAYLYGLVLTDGHLTKDPKRGPSGVNLVSKDDELIDLFRYGFRTDAHVNLAKKTGLRSVTVRSRTLGKQVFDLGMDHVKSFNAAPPKHLPEAMYPHFVRGCSDGDGSVVKDQRHFMWTLGTSSENLMLWLKERFHDVTGKDPYIRIELPNETKWLTAPHYKIYGFGPSGREWLRWMYPADGHPFYLTRKAAKANEALYGELYRMLALAKPAFGSWQ